MAADVFQFRYRNDYSELALDSAESFTQYLEEYVAFYSKFDTEAFAQNKQPSSFTRSALIRVAKLKSQMGQHSTGGVTIEQLAQSAKQAFDGAPPHTSSAAQLLNSIWNDFGPEGVAGAIAAYGSLGYNPSLGEPISFQGALSLYLLKLGVSSKTPQSVKAALDATRKFYQDNQRADESKANEFFELLQKEVEQAASARENIAAWWLEKAEQLENATQQKLDERIKSFEGTQRAYEESMRLLRPRAYWQKKARGHEQRGLWLGIAAIGWLFIAGIGTIFGIWNLFLLAVHYSIELDGDKSIPAGVLGSLGAMGIVGTTTVFWIGRLAVRLWLSELHLGMDARERVTMIESYLALSKTGTVEEKQRELVLAAIFRPTQDGIVKDDSASDPTLIGILSRQRI